MQLIKTVTTRGTRYYINGRRVTRDAYDTAKIGKRLECLQTVRFGDGWKHYACVR